MSRRRLLVIALAGIAVSLTAEYLSIHRHVHENHLLDVAVGWSYLAAGLVAWWRAPRNRMGPLMVLFSFAWFSGNFGNASWPFLISFGTAYQSINAAILAHLILAYPTGRLTSRRERVVVVAIYAWALIHDTAIALTFDPSNFDPRCFSCAHTVAPFPSLDAYNAWVTAGDWAQALLATAVLALVIERFVRATRPARRMLTPLWIASALTGVAFIADSMNGSNNASAVQKVAQILIPIAFLVGVLRTRMTRSAIGDLVVKLGEPLQSGGLRRALAESLGDPSLELAFALPDGSGYVDELGRPFTLPVDSSTRAVTEVFGDGRAIAAMIHDPVLAESQSVVDAAGAAARLALENERLQAELRAQLEAVRASRARLVGTADAERRRLERDLHDGAQQRLITLSLALALARDQAVDSGDPQLSATLAEAVSEASLVLSELRELAHGLHPAILTEAGLGPALESLAERSSLPTTVICVPGERLPSPVEATAYFVASEALANAAKHSHASLIRLAASRTNGALVLEIADDGAGGADPAAGSGLRGLSDRVAAVGGSFQVTSTAGEGTRVTAEIPCGSP